MLGLSVGWTSPMVIVPVVEEPGEDVVAVGGHDELRDRGAHALGAVAGEHVAEVAGGHREGDRAALAPAEARRSW